MKICCREMAAKTRGAPSLSPRELVDAQQQATALRLSALTDLLSCVAFRAAKRNRRPAGGPCPHPRGNAENTEMQGKGKGSWDTLPGVTLPGAGGCGGGSSTSENADASKHINLPQMSAAATLGRFATFTLNYTRSAGQFAIVANLLVHLVKMQNYYLK